VLGASVAGREASLRRAVAEGHELGNHLYSHLDPATLSDAELRAELRRTNALIEAEAGVLPRLFRPPYAGFDRRVARIAAAEGLRPTVLRSVDPADWREAAAQTIVDHVLAAAGPGEIVCLHDGVPPNNSGSPTRRPTVEALAAIIPALRAERFELVTASELLG
jgi:peptidoglycan/xylan/chitin deacetylase (PgdA/CDA1 family)